jgi:hypothetical protein
MAFEAAFDKPHEQRRMTGEQRLAIALNMSRIAREAAESRVRQKRPLATDTEVIQRMRRLIALSRQTEVDIDRLPPGAY